MRCYGPRPMKLRFWATLLLGLMAYVVLPLPGLSAPLNKRIENQRAKVEKKKRKEGVLTSTISRYNNRINGLQGEINGLRERQRRIQATLDGKRAELLDARDKLERSRDRLVRLRADLATSQKALSARLVEIYKSDEPDALTVVLEADGFADLLDRAEFIDRISEQDQRIVRTVRRLKAEATKQERELQGLEKKAEAAANVIAARKNELVTSKDRLVRSQTTLAGARGERRAVLSKVRNSRQKAQEDLRSLEAANAQAQRALQGAGGQLNRKPVNGGPIKRGSGQLHLADQRFDLLAVRHALGPPARGARPARRGGHPDPGGRLRPHGARLGHRRLRQLHLRPAHRFDVDLLCAPVALRDLGRRVGLPGRGDRLRRQHGSLLRSAPALRGPDQRQPRRSDGLPVAADSLPGCSCSPS